MDYFLLIVDDGYEPEDGDAFDAVVGALDFCEIPGYVIEVDEEALPTKLRVRRESVLSGEQRQSLIEALMDYVTHPDCSVDVHAEALDIGRRGFRLLDDSRLIELADRWEVDPASCGIDDAALQSLRKKGALAGRVADGTPADANTDDDSANASNGGLQQ
jgi:hypothetical protein